MCEVKVGLLAVDDGRDIQGEQVCHGDVELD
jgi:hypothetical protein